VPPRLPTSAGSLSDLARHVILPSGIVSTGWPAVRDTCLGWGVSFDGWQDGIGRSILAKRADGQYAAGIGGVMMSICRQVGKTFTVGMMIMALCVLFPGLKVVWTAHRTRTSDETFKSFQGMAKRKKLAPHILIVRRANGQQEIEFVNGSRIMFGARESGFGRGFDEVDVLVFDEAQILTQKALDDMVPATNVAANPLILYMGTPPKPSDPSEVFVNRRVEALSGTGDDALYIEFSADSDADVEDRTQWRKGNPSYLSRTPEASMLRMKKNLGDESFRREGMGIWDDAAALGKSSIDWAKWSALASPAPDSGRVAYAVKFSADGSRVAIGAAVQPENGVPHVELVKVADMAAGTSWLVDWLSTRWRTCSRITIDGAAGAGALVNALRAAKIPARVLHTPSVGEVIEAHSMIAESIRAATLSHFPEKNLDDAVRGAGKRPIGRTGGWGWSPLSPDVDVTPLDAVTLALHALTTSKRGSGRATGDGRRATVS